MTPPADVRVPDLRPLVDGQPVPGTELPGLTTVLPEIGTWLDQGEHEDPGHPGLSQWLAWPDDPDFRPLAGPLSLNTGLAGIAWYSAAAAAATPGGSARDEERLARAVRGLEARWAEDVEDRILFGLPGRGTAFYAGLAGIAGALIPLAGTDPGTRDLAVRVVREVLARQGTTGGREAGWTGTDALIGDGGIVLTLLAAADAWEDEEAMAAALRTGEQMLAGELPAEVGSTWVGTDPAAIGVAPGVVLDGFELGGIGIAYALARLAQSTGDPRFLAPAERVLERLRHVSLPAGEDGALFRRHDGNVSFGYCSGSAGVARAFLGMFRATGDPEHLRWAQRYGMGILRSGVPGRQTPSNGWVLHQCCGSAAVLETVIGLWLETGDRVWLDAARAQTDDLLIRSRVDERGRRWYSEAYVLPVGRLKAEVGYQVGAAGIGTALARMLALEQALAGERPFSTRRLPDDPYATSWVPPIGPAGRSADST